jgi:uncharacterized protein
MTKQKIAIIGAGITGLSCAWHLNQSHEITLFEKAEIIGGHSHSVQVDNQWIDMGFIVFNEPCYPNLVEFFKALGVAHEESNMSFAVSMNKGGFEYSSLNILAQLSNILRPRFWRMVFDILRFNKNAKALDVNTISEQSLGEYLAQNNYSKTFIYDHLIPQASAIWSTSVKEILDYPFTAFLGFFKNHNLLEIDDKNRHIWRTISGASRNYVQKVSEILGDKIKCNSQIKEIVRQKDGAIIHHQDGSCEQFDKIVFACHADEALSLINNPSDKEKEILGAFSYTQNLVVMHTDTDLMPKRKKAWASWNFIENENPNNPVSVSYWMNLLQNLKGELQYFVTLNPAIEINPQKIIKTQMFSHPKFDAKAIKAQGQINEIMGKDRLYFGGAYLGFGFHEDGIEAGIRIAELISGKARPWKFDIAKTRLPTNLFS